VVHRIADTEAGGFRDLRQGRLATVSRTAESSSASRLWRASGTMSRSPVPAPRTAHRRRLPGRVVAEPGLLARPFCMPSLSRYPTSHPGTRCA
jgi:hypothetical protein